MRNVRKQLEKYFKIFSNPTLFLGIGACLLTGCEASRDSICKEIPASVREVSSFRSELDSRLIGRRIASVGKGKSAKISPEGEDVASWMDWTERTLKRAQWARDTLQGDKNSKKAIPYLSEASLSLVSLHGFLEQKKWQKAYQQLERIGENLEKVNAIACVPAKAAPNSVERAPAAVLPQKKARKGKK